MSEFDNLPTISQILKKADSIGDVPMDEEEAAEWFERTRKDNRHVAEPFRSILNNFATRRP